MKQWSNDEARSAWRAGFLAGVWMMLTVALVALAILSWIGTHVQIGQ